MTHPDKVTAGIFAMLEAFPFPASVTDHSNRFLAVNRAFAQLYRRPIEGLAGRSPRLLTPDDYSEALLRELDKATSAGGWSGRLPNCDARSCRFEISLRTVRVAQSDGTYYLGVACKPGEEEALQRALLDSLWRSYAVVAAKADPHFGLSAREYQIRCRLLAGQTCKEIAYELGLAQATVRVLAMRVRGKLKRKNLCSP